MTSHYNITLLKTSTTLKVTYRNGKFKRVEHLRGVFTQEMLNAIGNVIPAKESDFSAFKSIFENRVDYIATQIKPKTLYGEFNATWFSFCNTLLGVAPKFSGADGAALKQIISYMTSITDSEEHALALWQALLSNWDKLDKFHQNKIDLKYINSKLNILLNNVKNNSSNTAAVFSKAVQSEVGKGFNF